MKTVFILSKEDLGLARAELSAVMKKGKNDFEIDENLVICYCSESEVKKAKARLAFCNSMSKLLFSCSPRMLEKEMKKFNWEKTVVQSYVLRKINCENSKIKDEKYYGSIIWNLLKKPRVELNDAKTKIILACGKKAYVCLLLAETDKSYLQRAAAMKPSLQPTAIKPKIAKAMVNLSGAEKNETVADPFCGTAGLLVEAGLMGIKTVGMDVSKKVLSFAEQNLKKNNISKKYWKLSEADATKAKIKADYVVTDLPYGRNSILTGEMGKLYLAFLVNMKKWKIKKAVLGFPDFFDYKKIIKKAGLSMEQEFEQYLHKSLTKKIVVVK